MKPFDITDALDLIGVALVACGLAFGLWPYIAGFALVVAGLAVIGSAMLASKV